MTYSVRQNLRDLAEAQVLGELVRFIYVTNAGDEIPKVGTVRNLSATHVTLNDTFHGGAARTCVLANIKGTVGIQGR